jgi:hypothetical protein
MSPAPRLLGNIVTGAFAPVLAKHSKSFSLIDCISVGVDRMQRNFEPMRKQVEVWQRSELTDVTAKVVIYEAFVEGSLDAPKHLARIVHEPLLRTEVRRIPAENDLESLQRVHFSVQGTGPDPSIQGDRQAGRVPGISVLAVVLIKRRFRRTAGPLFGDSWSTVREKKLASVPSCPAVSRVRLLKPNSPKT